MMHFLTNIIHIQAIGSVFLLCLFIIASTMLQQGAITESRNVLRLFAIIEETEERLAAGYPQEPIDLAQVLTKESLREFGARFMHEFRFLMFDQVTRLSRLNDGQG